MEGHTRRKAYIQVDKKGIKVDKKDKKVNDF